MTDDEIAFFKSIAGGRNPPKHPVRELWAACARRTGKDLVASGVGAYSGAFFDQQDLLRPGERATILCLACDQSQARIVLNYTRSYFADIPMLRSMVTRETKSGFELNNRVDVTVASNDYRSVRGRPVKLAILDERAFFRSENSASPDIELYNAIRPALASLAGSRIIGISSPYRKSGLLWNKYRKHFGQDDDDVLVIQAATRTLNPTIDQAFIDQALADDPIGGLAEWGGQFRPDISGYADFELIDAAVDRGITVRPPRQGVTYIGACDPGGGVRDRFVGAVCHDEGGVAVLDAVLEIRAPYSPTAACEQVAGMLRSYNVRTVTGDRYSAQFVVDAFSKHGVVYEHSKRDRSAIYQDALPLFTSGRARLLDNPRMVNQFASLERRTVHSEKTVSTMPRAGATTSATQRRSPWSWRRLFKIGPAAKRCLQLPWSRCARPKPPGPGHCRKTTTGQSRSPVNGRAAAWNGSENRRARLCRMRRAKNQPAYPSSAAAHEIQTKRSESFSRQR